MSRFRRTALPRTMAIAVTTSLDIGAAMISAKGENVRMSVLPVLPVAGHRSIVDVAGVAALVKAWKPEVVALHFHETFAKMGIREATSIALSVGALRGCMVGLGVELAELDPYWMSGWSSDAEADRRYAIRKWPYLREQFTNLPASVAQAAMLARTARDPRGWYE